MSPGNAEHPGLDNQPSGRPFVTLAANPALRREAAALALYRLAEFGPWVAILVFAYGHGGATATGLVSLGLLVPTALLAPCAGPLIDRFGATRVLVFAYAGQTVALAATAASLVSGAPVPLTYCLATAAAVALAVTHPAHAVASPGIARTTEQLVSINAVTGWILSVGLVAGPAGAGLVLALASPGAVYAAGAACVATATALVFPLRDLVPPLATDDESTSAESAFSSLADGIRGLARSGPSREVVLVLVATFFMVGAFDVLAVALAIGALHIGGSGAGYLTATHGAGAVAGAGCSFALVGRRRLVPVILVAATLAAVAFLLLGLRPAPPVAFAAAAALGAGFARALLEMTGQTLLQRVTPTALLARAFALKEGLAMAAWGFGSAFVPVAVSLTSLTGAAVMTAAIVPAVVLLRLRPLLRVDSAIEVPVVTVALLRSLEIFRALPVPALEGVAHSARTTVVPAGTVIVRQGQHGDDYYAIADGMVEVTRDGLALSTLARGEGFGEIALLHDVPRTATITARTEVTLIAIEREAFLVAVTGHSRTRGRAERVATTRLLADSA